MSEAGKSQAIHEEMIKKLEEAKKLKAEAESVHRLFLQVKEKTSPIKEEMERIVEEIRRQKEEIALAEAEERRKSEESLLENIAKQALEKLKRGEKLTWEEFRILAEKGLA